MKKILMLTGDYSEDYEVMVPYQALTMLELTIDVVCPGKKKDEYIKTAIHDFEGDQTYTEKLGHLFKLTASFDQLNLDDYAGLYITGGRSSEYIRLNPDVLHIVRHAMGFSLPVAAICHGIQVLVAADVLQNRTLTAYPTVKPEVELAGGTYVAVSPDESVIDKNLVTSPAWPGHPAILRDFIQLLGIKILH